MRSVLEWLEATAQRLPHKIAVADPETSLSYEGLLKAAQAAGSVLALNNMQPRTAIAFYLEKSPYALAGMLGAVYAGGFYCVLDVRQPKNRLLNICNTLNPFVIVTDKHNYVAATDMFENTHYRVVRLEQLFDGTLQNESATNRGALDTGARDVCCTGATTDVATTDVATTDVATTDVATTDVATTAFVDTFLSAKLDNKSTILDERRAQALDIDPLYVNFTSGSTGTPKGVVVSHRSVIDFIPVFTSCFGMDETDVFANQAPFDFDVSVKDIYSCLFLGARLQLIPRPYFTAPTTLMDYLADSQVTTLVWAVSAMCFVSIMGGLDYRVPQTIKRVLFSGEVMPPKQLARWRKHLGNVSYVNLYGPTEITCNCTYYIIDRDFKKNEVIPMGRPFPNERVLLLDEADQEIHEANREGEVCVSGTALALGYLGDSERTEQAFVQNPLNKRWLEPLYRTGDLAKYDVEGNLVYCSRKDHQIKHMGQRIELGDIEATAQSFAGVDQAVCIYDAKHKRIHMFYVGDAQHEEVSAGLRESLPSYMVPNDMRRLDVMPLTKNGKVDRSYLAKLK